jgi:hypothetical protein
MSRRIAPRREALADQIVAILREADGFPQSTGDIARQLGDRLHSWPHHQPPLGPRPPCWPDEHDDQGLTGQAWCNRCNGFHRPPVWRRWDANDIRPILNRLAAQGQAEKVVLDGMRHHYWRGGAEA